MRVVAAVPASGLLAGCALGFLVVDRPLSLPLAALVVAAATAATALYAEHRRLFLVAVVLSFAAGGAILTTVAWQRAWRSSLRLAFESMARDQRAAALAAGQRVTLDDTANAIVD